MQKCKLLIIGANDRLIRRVISLLADLPNVATSQKNDLSDIEIYLAEHRFDVILLEAGPGFAHEIGRIHHLLPSLPVVAYDHNPDHARTREVFLSGARDLIKLHGATPDEAGDLLERAINPLRQNTMAESQQQIRNIRSIIQRGASFISQLNAGAPPAFYMNGNRATLLRANVLSLHPSTLWQQEAAWSWIQEFGAGNSFLFESSSGELRLAAMVEQDYVNAASFKRMLNTQLERFYTSLGELNCVCVATHCSTDYLNLAMLHRLDSIVDLVFYVDECQTILDSVSRITPSFPVQLFDEFCSAVAVRNASTAIACVDRAVVKLCNDLPAPGFARSHLGRFVWSLISVVGCQSNQYMLSHLDDSHIRLLRNAIVNLIRSTLASEASMQSVSPLDELIRRIEANPGLPINIDQAAEEINFSRSHFCRLFRQQTGLSFTQFLTKKRVTMACDLLKKTAMPVDEISNIVGINNTWYFKKLFLKEIGMPVEDWIALHGESSAVSAE